MRSCTRVEKFLLHNSTELFFRSVFCLVYAQRIVHVIKIEQILDNMPN